MPYQNKVIYNVKLLKVNMRLINNFLKLTAKVMILFTGII